MEKIVQFLNENNIGVVATSSENKPFVRIQHAHLIKDIKQQIIQCMNFFI